MSARPTMGALSRFTESASPVARLSGGDRVDVAAVREPYVHPAGLGQPLELTYIEGLASP